MWRQVCANWSSIPNCSNSMSVYLACRTTCYGIRSAISVSIELAWKLCSVQKKNWSFLQQNVYVYRCSSFITVGFTKTRTQTNRAEDLSLEWAAKRNVRTGAAAAQPSMHWVPECCPGSKRPERGFDHWPPSRAEIKNEWSCTSTPPTYLHSVERDTLFLPKSGPQHY